jgi:hypothetical protein
MIVADLHQADEKFRIDFDLLAVPEDALQTIRRDLYHSSGHGYYVFRNFLKPDIAGHMQRFWSELQLDHVHQPLPAQGVKMLFAGCPDYYYGTQDGDHRGYLNFFWNHPADEVSYAVAMQVQWLRNRVMGKAPHADIFPLNGRAVSSQVVVSMRGKVVTRPHRDFDGDDWIRDPSKLQATLFLSTPGVDYVGDGFILETNKGDSVRFGHEVPVACGDLVLWRYSNHHSVLNVESSNDQCGFIRMLFPIEETPKSPPPAEPPPSSAPIPVLAPPRISLRHAFLSRLRETPLGRHVLVPIWHRIRGR